MRLFAVSSPRIECTASATPGWYALLDAQRTSWLVSYFTPRSLIFIDMSQRKYTSCFIWRSRRTSMFSSPFFRAHNSWPTSDRSPDWRCNGYLFPHNKLCPIVYHRRALTYTVLKYYFIKVLKYCIWSLIDPCVAAKHQSVVHFYQYYNS